MVSVLVSVSDPETPKSVLQMQLRLEARAGIGHLSGDCGAKMTDLRREPSINQFNSGTAYSNSVGVRFGVHRGTPGSALS
jgi:hypothetical protein